MNNSNAVNDISLGDNSLIAGGFYFFFSVDTAYIRPDPSRQPMNFEIGSIGSSQIIRLGIYSSGLMELIGGSMNIQSIPGGYIHIQAGSDLTLTAAGSIFFATDTGAQADFFFFQNIKDGSSVLTIDQNHAFYDVGGIKILGAQQAAIADSTGVLLDLTTKFNTLLAELRVHGLIAT